MSFPWTEDQVRAAVDLHRQGKSASAIALAIGAPTRNVVIGKLARLGIARGLAQKAQPVSLARPAAASSQALAKAKIAGTPKAKRDERIRPTAAGSLPPDDAAHREERRQRFQAIADKAIDKFDEAIPQSANPVRFLDRGLFQCATPQRGWETTPVSQKMVCGRPVQPGTSWCRECMKVLNPPASFSAFKNRTAMEGVAA